MSVQAGTFPGMPVPRRPQCKTGYGAYPIPPSDWVQQTSASESTTARPVLALLAYGLYSEARSVLRQPRHKLSRERRIIAIMVVHRYLSACRQGGARKAAELHRLALPVFGASRIG